MASYNDSSIELYTHECDRSECLVSLDLEKHAVMAGYNDSSIELYTHGCDRSECLVSLG